MTEKALHAFLWDALSFQCTLPVLKQFLASMQARHSRFKLGSPIGGDGDWTRMIHAVSRFQGRQRRHLYPIHRDIVVNSSACRRQHTLLAPDWRADARRAGPYERVEGLSGC